MSVFQYIQYFSSSENWGDSTKINGLLLLLLDTIRARWGKRFIIHCAYATAGHTPKSQHYQGNAVDFHIVDELPFYMQVEKMEQILLELQVSNRVGLGIYPDWAHPGFHLDVRGTRARWGRIGSEYVGFNTALAYAKRKGI